MCAPKMRSDLVWASNFLSSPRPTLPLYRSLGAKLRTCVEQIERSRFHVCTKAALRLDSGFQHYPWGAKLRTCVEQIERSRSHVCTKAVPRLASKEPHCNGEVCVLCCVDVSTSRCHSAPPPSVHR